jgi:hypothetical protein
MNRFKEMQAALEREVSAWDGVNLKVEHSGRHARARLGYCGKERSLVISVSSSDKRALLNCVCLARRTLREMGAHKNDRT